MARGGVGRHLCAASAIKHDSGAPICGARVSARMLMCPVHWYMVKRETRGYFYRAYRRRGGRPDSPLAQDYLDAVDACLADVREVLGKRS